VNAVRLPTIEAAKQTSSPGITSQADSQHGNSQSGSALSECVARTVRRYLADIGDTECAEGLHALVLREVEIPLLREVLAFHDGNQSRAACALGINRATLRKKLATHGLL
jgi:Fis family transcriptional regulator